MSLAPSLFIDPNGTAQLSGTAAPTALKGPTEYRALGETIALGQLAARTPPKELRSDSLVESFGPFHACPEGLIGFPGPMMATAARTLKASQMQP